ncbi:MAG TPA: DNA polymerase IV [Halococcus sp.]|nr:DNA polymerase IV [Halococcus sp.]
MAERGGPRLPGISEDDGQIVFHVDMDCFYAACERRRDPDLRGEPVVVGMGYEPGESHGAVATASYEARAHGVESAQAISTALDRLPRAEDEPNAAPVGHYRPVEMAYYESVSEEVMEILHDCATVVREVSIDEAALDVTEETSWERVSGRTLAEGYARHIKERIQQEVGVTASIGVAPNMSAAKVAADHDKPDGLVVIEPDEVEEFLAPLDIETVHGVGPVTARELRGMDIETAGDLAATGANEIEARFGERGREIRSFARGDDTRPVTPIGRPKSLSRESAFTDATTNTEDKRERVRTLATAVAERAAREDALYQTIGIKVVMPPFDVNTRARSLSGPVADASLVREVALDLLSEFADAAVRKVGVRVSNLSFEAGEQASLDGFDTGDTETGRADSGAERTDPDGTDTEATGSRAFGSQTRFGDFERNE